MKSRMYQKIHQFLIDHDLCFTESREGVFEISSGTNLVVLQVNNESDDFVIEGRGEKDLFALLGNL